MIKENYFYYDNYLRYRLISLLSNKVFLSIFTEQEILKKLCAHIKNKSESIWHEEFTENDFIIKKFVTDNKV